VKKRAPWKSGSAQSTSSKLLPLSGAAVIEPFLISEDGDASGDWLAILDKITTLAEPSPEALALQRAYAPVVSEAVH
jgi:hypothetical protein